MVPIIQQTVYARGDLQFMQKGAVSRKVSTLRYENIPQDVVNTIHFSKREFTDTVVFGRMGVSNKFGCRQEKCTLVYLDSLPGDLATQLQRSMYQLLNFIIIILFA